MPINTVDAAFLDRLAICLEERFLASVRVERSLYQRAVGYSYDAVKIYCDKNGR